jgi:hypothetical protein
MKPEYLELGITMAAVATFLAGGTIIFILTRPTE